jgi:predicted phosphodiesterase
MRYLVLADIHANLEALEAVLTAAAARRYDRVLVLGDLVGYGPDPNAVVDRVRALEPAAVIRGNHDKVAAGVETAEGFNPIALEAARWTIEALVPESRRYLATLSQGPQQVDDLIEICHGTPFDEDVYVFDELDALRALQASTRPLCLFGHTHMAAGYSLSASDFAELPPGDSGDVSLDLDSSTPTKYLVNVGSVGQPRDGDPRAAYGIVDTESRTLFIYRIAYALQQTQVKLRQAGLPELLAHRLQFGR